MARPPLAILGILFGLQVILKRDWNALLRYILIGSSFAIIYFSYNIASYGAPIVSSYALLFEGQSFDFSTWNGINLLFSNYRGWFVYTPIAILSVAGLILNLKKMQNTTAMLSAIVFTAILYGFWPIWWGGDGFGQRFMISFVPFIAFGLAIFIARVRQSQISSKLKSIIYSSLVILTLWSILITGMYRFTPVADLKTASEVPKIQRGVQLKPADIYTPMDMVDYQLRLITTSDSLSNYLGLLAANINGGGNLAYVELGLMNHVLRVDDREISDMKLKLISQANNRRDLIDEIEFAISSETNERVQIIRWDTSQAMISFDCTDNCTPISGIQYLDVSEVERNDFPEEIYPNTKQVGDNQFYFKDYQAISIR